IRRAAPGGDFLQTRAHGRAAGREPGVDVVGAGREVPGVIKPLARIVPTYLVVGFHLEGAAFGVGVLDYADVGVLTQSVAVAAVTALGIIDPRVRADAQIRTAQIRHRVRLAFVLAAF